VSGVAGSRRVVVAGVAGGVGTTTVTALLFTTLSGDSSPRLVDHSGGDLGARLTGGDDAGRVDRSLSLHDLGAHADGALIDLLAEPDVFGVVVGPTTEAGTADVRRVLEKVRERRVARDDHERPPAELVLERLLGTRGGVLAEGAHDDHEDAPQPTGSMSLGPVFRTEPTSRVTSWCTRSWATSKEARSSSESSSPVSRWSPSQSS
jgi:hypothetical protein